MTTPNPRLNPVKVYGRAAPAPAAGPRRGASPVLAGVLVAIPAAAIWAIIAYVTHYEIGWVAWGIGALIGFVVGKSATEPGPHGVIAAAIAVGALILAKILILEFALPAIVQQEVLKDREGTAAMFLIDMGENRAFSPELQAEAERASAGAGESSAGDRTDMLAAQMAREAQARAQAATPAERARVVRRHTDAILKQAGFFAVLARLFSFWDFVWIFLAIGSAFRIANRASAFQT